MNGGLSSGKIKGSLTHPFHGLSVPVETYSGFQEPQSPVGGRDEVNKHGRKTNFLLLIHSFTSWLVSGAELSVRMTELGKHIPAL